MNPIYNVWIIDFKHHEIIRVTSYFEQLNISLYTYMKLSKIWRPQLSAISHDLYGLSLTITSRRCSQPKNCELSHNWNRTNSTSKRFGTSYVTVLYKKNWISRGGRFYRLSNPSFVILIGQYIQMTKKDTLVYNEYSQIVYQIFVWKSFYCNHLVCFW